LGVKAGFIYESASSGTNFSVISWRSKPACTNPSFRARAGASNFAKATYAYALLRSQREQFHLTLRTICRGGPLWPPFNDVGQEHSDDKGFLKIVRSWRKSDLIFARDRPALLYTIAMETKVETERFRRKVPQNYSYKELLKAFQSVIFSAHAGQKPSICESM
jgi:hypothetical protein